MKKLLIIGMMILAFVLGYLAYDKSKSLTTSAAETDAGMKSMYLDKAVKDAAKGLYTP